MTAAGGTHQAAELIHGILFSLLLLLLTWLLLLLPLLLLLLFALNFRKALHLCPRLGILTSVSVGIARIVSTGGRGCGTALSEQIAHALWIRHNFVVAVSLVCVCK